MVCKARLEDAGRSPCGERGLKCYYVEGGKIIYGSLPVRGAWIEITYYLYYPPFGVSLPVRGAWIEMSDA